MQTLRQAWNDAARLLARARTLELELYVDERGSIRKNVDGRVTGKCIGRSRTANPRIKLLGMFPTDMELDKLRERLRSARVFPDS